MRTIGMNDIPVTVDGRINWKEYFLDHAQVGDQFMVPKTMRSGIQRQAQDCGFAAHSATVNATTIRITVHAPDTISRKILAALATLAERQLVQIHHGCVQAKILPPL